MEIYYSKTQTKEELLKIAFENRNVDINKVEFFIKEHGKPSAKNIDFDFNISHTKGFIAVCTGTNVGIDCEKIRPVKNSVMEKVCTEQELQDVYIKGNSEEEFMRLWTFKEAFTKMIGSGYRYGFKNATIYNAMYLHSEIKIFQKKFDDVMLCAIERVGEEILITEI